jgi:hypothetical protein
VRLQDDFSLPWRPEEVRFNMDDPIVLTRPRPRPRPGEVEIVGWVEMPIRWTLRRS